MRLTSVLPLLALSANVIGAQGRPADARAVPVYREPRHRLVLENQWVRVLDVRAPAGDTSGYHVHAQRHIGVVIAGARTWEQRLGTTPSAVDSVADSVGTVFDNAADSLPLAHRVGNADATPFHYVVAQILRPWGAATPPLALATGLRRTEDLSGVRVYRATLAPGQAIAEHRHGAPGLTVQIENGRLRWEGTAPGAVSAQTGAGAWWWREAGATHVLRNVGAASVSIVEFDWP